MASVEREIARRRKQLEAAGGISQSAAIKKDAPVKSLVSSETLSKYEPSTALSKDARTGGRHHGTMSAIADAVAHTVAHHEVTNPDSSHTGTALRHMDEAYSHLAMHHVYHLQGQHDKAAGSLMQAGKSVMDAMGRIGGSAKSGVANAYGEKHSRPELEETVKKTVSHYADMHGVSTSARTELPPKEELLKVDGSSGGTGAREVSIKLSRSTGEGNTKTHALGGQQLAEYTRRVSERGGDVNRSPGLERMATMRPVMTRKDHILQAHSDLMNKGKIHKNQLAALSSGDVNRLHEITNVSKPRDTRSSSLPSTPMPRDRETK